MTHLERKERLLEITMKDPETRGGFFLDPYAYDRSRKAEKRRRHKQLDNFVSCQREREHRRHGICTHTLSPTPPRPHQHEQQQQHQRQQQRRQQPLHHRCEEEDEGEEERPNPITKGRHAHTHNGRAEWKLERVYPIILYPPLIE